MEGRHFAAALILPLVLATAARAQSPGDDRSRISTDLLGPSYLPADRGASALPSLAEAPAGLSASSYAYTGESGPRAFGNRLIGALPVGKDVHIGIGLMSVSRYSQKEPDFKRAPMKDVEGRRQRIAAIGLSFSF